MNLHVTARGNRFAALGQSIKVDVDHDSGVITLRAPFYRRSIQLSDIVQASCSSDDGANHGLVNWFVVGKPTSLQGTRLNTGGNARVNLETCAGARYQVVVDTMDQAEAIVDAVQNGRDSAACS